MPVLKSVTTYLIIGLLASTLTFGWLWMRSEKSEVRVIEECNTEKVEAALNSQIAANKALAEAYRTNTDELLARLAASRDDANAAVADQHAAEVRLQDAEDQLATLRRRPADPANAPVDESLRVRAYQVPDAD